MRRNPIHHRHANNRTRKPTDRTQKTKRLRRHPLPTTPAIRHAAPVESAAAAVGIKPVDEQAEGGEPRGR